MPDDDLDLDTNPDADPDPDTERDEEQDERLKELEKAAKGASKQIGFGTITKVVGGFSAIIALVGTLVGYGMKYGELKSTVEGNAKAITELQGHPNQCRDNMEKLRDAIQERMRQEERAVGELRGSMMALRTEVRVRHEEHTFAPSMVAMGQQISSRPPGIEPFMQPPGKRPVRITVKTEKALPQDVQEDLAAEAADLAMDEAVKAAPSPQDDPLQKLTF